eukprot:scaffold230992_cov35-Prasinocladus_malaysianus.AAC.1
MMQRFLKLIWFDGLGLFLSEIHSYCWVGVSRPISCLPGHEGAWPLPWSGPAPGPAAGRLPG